MAEPTGPQLIIVRHAKASWPDDVTDHERPLTGRGRRDATALGIALAERRIQPQVVLCSTARRAQQTWSLAASAWTPAGAAPELRLVAEAYDAPSARLLELLRGLGTDAQPACAILVAHNPGLEELVARLTGVGEHLRTATCVRLALDQPWAHAETAQLAEVFTTRARRSTAGQVSG